MTTLLETNILRPTVRVWFLTCWTCEDKTGKVKSNYSLAQAEVWLVKVIGDKD